MSPINRLSDKKRYGVCMTEKSQYNEYLNYPPHEDYTKGMSLKLKGKLIYDLYLETEQLYVLDFSLSKAAVTSMSENQ